MTGPRVYSPDNPFAQQATAPVTYSPDNPFAPKLKPLPPLRSLPMTAASDATAQPTGPRREPTTRIGKLIEAPFRLLEQGPLGVAQMATAPAVAAGTGAAFMGQTAAEMSLPADVRARALEDPKRISETEAAIAAAQLATPMLAGPIARGVESPIARALGKYATTPAAARAAQSIAGAAGSAVGAAPIGAAYMPTDPITGAVLAAAGGAVHGYVAGGPPVPVVEPQAQPTIPVERQLPSPLRRPTATARMAGRAQPGAPDYDVTTNAPEAPAPSLPAPQAPKLLPRLRRVAPEEPEAPAAAVAPEPPAAPPAPPVAPAPVAARPAPAGTWFPEEDVNLPAAVAPQRARTGSGRMMSNLSKATPEQLTGEYRALIDSHEQDAQQAHGSVRIFGSLDYADDPSSGGHLGDVGMVTTPAGMKAAGRMAQRQKSIEKIEAELTKRGIDHADAYWMGGGETMPGTVGEAKPPYGGVTPEQRKRFEAVRWSAARALEIGKQRQAQLDQPEGPPDLEPALNRERGVGERTPGYGKKETLTGVAFRRKDGGQVYSMQGFDGGHSELFDQLEAGGEPTVNVPGEGRFERATATFDHGFVTSSGRFVDRAEALKIARANHQVESEDRAKGFGLGAENIKGAKVSEARPKYGKFEMRRMQQRADEEQIDVRAAGMNDTETLPSDPSVKMGLLTDANLQEMNQAWIRDYLNPAHPPEYKALLEADRAALDAEIMRRLKPGKIGTVREGTDAYGDQTDTPAFKKWFGDSKIVGPDGKPAVSVHYTNAEFEAFSHEASGFQSKGYTTDYGRGYVFPRKGFFFFVGPDVPSGVTTMDRGIPVFLSIKNPLDLKAGLSPVQASALIDYMKRTEEKAPTPGMSGFKLKGALVGGLKRARVEGMTGQQAFDLISQSINTDRGRKFDKVLADLGYDGMVFPANSSGTYLGEPMRGRADGKEYTVAVALEPTQIKSAIGNRGTFDSTDPSVVRETSTYDDSPKLAVLHNLSADNLEFADKMGGLAVPSLGVVKQGQHYSGMGQITLLGKPHLGDPKAVPIHDADVYSTTFPRAEYPKAREKDAQQVVNELREAAKRFDDQRVIDTVWDNAINTPKPEDSVVQMLRSPAAQAVFLKSKGVNVEPVLEKATVEPGFVTTKAWRDFQRTTGYETNYSYADTAYREKLAAAVKSAIEEQVARRKDPQIRELLRDSLVNRWIGDDGLVPFGYTPAIDRALAAIGRMDVERTKTEAKLAEALKGHENEFRDWVEKKILPMHGEPFLRLGRKRVPFTLANVVEAMTGPVKNQEKTMTFGEGQARAAAASRLTSVEHMRNASYRIEGEANIEKAREHAKTLLSEWRDAVLPFYTEHDWRGDVDTWRGLDASMRAVARWAKGRGLAEALRAEGFKSVPSYVVNQGVKAGQAFLDAPVPYFEAKPQRAVTLDEFAGAVIPKSASPKVREILAKHGIETEEYSSDTAGEPERGAAIARLQDRLEQKGNGVLFERAPDPRQVDAFTSVQLDAFDAAPAVEARAVEKFGSMAKAQRAIALVEKHAGKFATTYNGPAPRVKGRLQKIGLRNKGGSMVDLVGQKIKGPRDLAKALYPFRSPLHERFFTIVHGEQGEILAATMDTSGAVNYVAPYGGGRAGFTRFLETIVRRVQRAGGKEVTIAHNHPSGLTNLSPDDVSFWHWMGFQLQERGIKLRGQLVIDHDEASWIAPGKEETKLSVPPGEPDWVDLSAPKLVTPEAVAAYVGAGANNGGLHVVYVNQQMQVIALEPHNPSALATVGTWLPAQARGMGAAGAMLVGPKDAVLDIIHAVGNANLSIPVHDIVTAEPQADGSVRFVSEAARGTLYGRNFQGAKRTETEEARAFRRLSEANGPVYGQGGRRPGAGEAGAVQPFHGVGEAPTEYGRGAEYKKARAAGIASGLTPEQADAYAAAAKDIDFDGAKAVAHAKAEAGGLRTRLRRWADAAADQTRSIDRLGRAAVERGMPPEKAPEYELALSYNSDDTIRRALYNAPEMATTHGVLDPITREPMGPTLESVVEPLGKDPEKIRQAFTYAVALRKAGRGLKATAGDPNELQAALDAVQALGQVPLYRKFAADLSAHLDAIGRYAVRSGLWTESQWEQLKHSDLFYVPFRRLMTHIEPPPGRTTYGVKRANLGAGIERFEGSRRFLANPVEAVAGYDARIIKRADAYRVGSAVIDALTQYMGEEGKAILTPLAANDPAVKAFAAAAVRRNLARSGLNVAEVGMVADLSAPQIDPHNPVIWRNRKGGMAPAPVAQTDAFGEETAPEEADREYYLLNDPDLYKALVATRADSPLGNGALMAAFRIARRLMTVTTTGINPRFALGLNIARDVPQAIMQVPGIRPDDIAAATAEAAKAVVGSSDFADILARHGLGSASIYAHDINPEAAARRIAPVTKGQAIGAKVRKIAAWPLETAERVGAASDLVARLAAARAVQRNSLKAGQTRRGALASGATTGIRATVNFNRRAGIPVLQFLEQSVPFFGASMRSMLRATEAVGEVPYRVLGAIGIVGLAVMAEWAITKNDKEKRAQQVDRLASERSRFVQFGKYRWPLSQEMAVVAAGVRMGLAQFTHDDPDSAEQLAQAVYNLLPPVASDLVQGDIIAPWPGWRELQEVAQNRQAYGNRPIVPERLADLPPALRRQESTSPTFDLVASLARKGAIIVPPLAETSPLAVEHVIRGFLQNMTPLLTMVTDAALSRTSVGKQMNVPVPAPLTAHPLNPASAFVVREPPTRTSSESWFYQRAREYTQGESAERMVGKMEDLAETPAGQARAATARRLGGGRAWGLSEDLTADVGLLIKEAQLTLKDYRESETEIRQQVNDGALAPQAARALLDSLTLERQHMLRETRNAMERLGVPSGARSSSGTRSIQPVKTPPKAPSPYSPENPFKP